MKIAHVPNFINPLKFLGLIVLFIVQSVTAQVNVEKVDSLKSLLSTAQGSDRYRILFDGLFVEYVDKDNEQALNFVTQAQEVAIIQGDSLNIVRSGRGRGYVLGKLGRNEEAIQAFLKVLAIAERNKFIDLEKFLLNNIALAYTYQADYDKALDFHFKSLAIREAAGLKGEISVTKNNIGLVYYRLKDFEKALNYYQQSLEIKREIGDLYDIERSLINIGLCYSQLRQYDKVLEFMNSAIRSCEPNCSDVILMESHAAKGLAYMEMGKLDEADQEFQQTLIIANKVKDNQFQAECFFRFGLIHQMKNDTEKAISNLKSAEILLLPTTNREELLRVYRSLADIYSNKSDFENASFYQSRHIQLKDSVYSEQLIKNLARVESAYLERENIKTIQEKDENIKLQNELIARQRLQYIFIVLVSILIVLLATVLIWANRRQHRHNAALSEAKRVIEDQNKELTRSNEELDRRVQQKTRDLFLTNESLSQVNEELDNFIYRTSHDIRGPLVTLKGVCNVALLDVKDALAIDYLNRLDLTAEKMNSILTRLLIVNQINHSDLEASTIDLKEMIDSILVSERKNGLPPNLSIEYQIDPSVKLMSDVTMIRIVLENLIDNSIKFYNTSERIKPYVKIKVDRGNSDKIRIRVEDNGIGINPRDKDQIFHLFVRASERSETGGIGLYLSKLSTHRLGGEIILADTSERGTTFLVLIPADLRPILEKRKIEEELRKKDKALREKEMQAAREKAGDLEAMNGISSKQSNLLTS